MRIAIVGAGLAGLACAHELERLGLSPDLFECRDKVGDRFPVLETLAQFMSLEPGQDIFDRLRQDLGLPINPHQVIHRAVLHGPSTEATISGFLGYSVIRGPAEQSLDSQLLRQVRTPVHYRSDPDVSALSQEYDHVVVATGNAKWPREFLRWRQDLEWWMRGAYVTGDFCPGEYHFFFNTRYAGTGYAMIAPIDERHASVGVAVPMAPPEEIEAYWHLFRSEQGHFWGEEQFQFQVDGWPCGKVGSPKLGNVLLVGAAGGFTEPLGITGVVPSLETGVLAARQLALGDRSLERFARRWRSFYDQALRIRHNVNAWTDRDMDRLVTAVSMGGSVIAHAPFSLIRPAGLVLDLLGRANDPSPGIGPL